MTAELVPLETPIDQEEARSALIEANGNVTAAAKAMHVRPERLRAYVQAIPKLGKVIDEIMEQGVDKAVSVLQEALNDELSFQNRFYAAKEFLRSSAGRKRGFGGQPTSQTVEVKSTANGVFTLKWLEPPDEE